jgi:hypothetical protein
VRISEILGAPVVDRAGHRIGVVRDLRLMHTPRFRVAGITIGQPGWVDEAAHAWGFAEGRARRPWPLRRLTERATRGARFAPVEVIDSWAPDRIVLTVGSTELRPLDEASSK